MSQGNEQRDYWGSESADREQSRNYAGIKNPAIDGIIQDLTKAQSRESLLAHAHALDRVLLWSHYVIPGYVEPEIWWAYWSKLGRPDATPNDGPNPATWWFDPAKAEKLAQFMKTRATSTPNNDGGSNNTLLLALAALAVLAGGVLAARRLRRT